MVYVTWKEQIGEAPREERKIRFSADLFWKLVEKKIISFSIIITDSNEDIITFELTFSWGSYMLSFTGEFCPELLVHSTIKDCKPDNPDPGLMLRKAYFRTPVPLIPETMLLTQLGVTAPKPSEYWQWLWQHILLETIDTLFDEYQSLFIAVEEGHADIKAVQQLISYIQVIQQIQTAQLGFTTRSACVLYSLPPDDAALCELRDAVTRRREDEYGYLMSLADNLRRYLLDKTSS